MAAAQARPSETKNVQGRLSVAGLAATCFETRERVEGPARKVEDLFAEEEWGRKDQSCSKVGIVESNNGGGEYEVL